MKNRASFRTGALASLFAALIFLTTAYLFHIPTGLNGGYIHLGDTFIYLAAAILPGPYAMAAAGIGGAMSDLLTGGAAWAPFTLVIKPLLAVWFTSKTEGILNRRNIAAVFLAGVTGLAGYYLAGALISGNFIAPFLTLPVDVIQPAASGAAFVAVGLALDKAKLKQRFAADLR